MNIYQRINAVMKQVAYVQKDTEVTGGGNYKAVSHDMAVAVLRPAMVEQGIVVRPKQLKGKYVEMRDKSQGRTMHLYAGRYQVDFVNIEDPGDYCSTVVEGHANDTGDKAPGKAMSYAVKYAMLKTFSLETGEDDEARFAEPYTPEQLELYHEFIETKDAYGFYLFIKTLPTETVTGLYNSFPEGKKTAGKKAATALENEGAEKFDNTVQDVKAKLANQDSSVTEITDELFPLEKKLMASRLTDFEVAQLKKMKGKAA